MLVIVHDWDVQFCFQSTFNLKCFWRLDVFQIDAAKRWSDRLHRRNKVVNVCGVDLNIKYINVRKDFEQHRFALHYRLARLGTNISQAKNSGTIGNDCHQVAFRRVLIDILRVFCNGHARLCHSWAIRQGQIIL